MKKIFVLFLTVIVFSGCKKESPTIVPDETPQSTKGIYILNEGGFGKSTASLSFYVPDSNKIYSDIFTSANNRGLGDVGNDIVLYNKKGFIVVQNSNKIEVISTETQKSLGILSLPGQTPNKLVIVNETKAYVTNLYKKSVTAFNPTSLAILKDSIAVGLNPQSMLVSNGKVFVCNSGYGNDNTISVIDPVTDNVIATINVAKGPTDIAIDTDGEIIILCTGYTDFSNPANDTPGNITVIDPKTNSVTATIPLPLAVYGHPNKLTVSNSGYGFTVGLNGIVKFDTKTNSIISSKFISKSAYSIAIDNLTEKIYLGDAINYVQNGKIYVYDKFAVLKDSITVGIIPGTIVFKR